MYFCFLFAVFAMVNWNAVMWLFGVGSDSSSSSSVPLSAGGDPAESSQWVADPIAAADDGDTICNHHNHRTDCFNS